MKKILLIVAIVLCVSIAGTALATTVYYNAHPATGTVTADNFVVLSLDGSSDIDEIALVAGKDTTYKIACDVATSGTNAANGTLTVALVAATSKTLAGVTVALYEDSECKTAVAGKEQTGAGSFTVEGIDTSVDYYAKVSFAGAASEDALANIGGSLNISFVQAD